MATESDAATPVKRRGRRRADEASDARAQIVAAAAQEFAAHGYDSASFRAIARRADVDPGLVRHYFADKADLFAEAVTAPVRPDRIVREVLAGPHEAIGENLVRLLLATMESPTTQSGVLGLLRTALGHDFAATMLRQFLVREVFHRIADAIGAEDGELRATLAASQVVGLMVVRYGVRAEPLASAPADEVVRRVGPVIQWHLTGFPKPLDAGSAASE
jgi:AcrR family transcriptional regulator